MAAWNRRGWGRLGIGGLLFVVATGSAAARGSGAVTAISVLGVRDLRLVRAASAAVDAASRKLENAPCRQVFSDFADRSGNSLAAKLDEMGQDGRGFLSWMVFLNGSNEAFCLSGFAGLATDPGSRLVHVCPRFIQLQADDPGFAAALIIHEELHVLGLAENPPSSAEITARVIARCGR